MFKTVHKKEASNQVGNFSDVQISSGECHYNVFYNLIKWLYLLD